MSSFKENIYLKKTFQLAQEVPNVVLFKIEIMTFALQTSILSSKVVPVKGFLHILSVPPSVEHA